MAVYGNSAYLATCRLENAVGGERRRYKSESGGDAAAVYDL